MAIEKIRIRKGYILREYAGEFCIFDASRTNDGAVNDIPSFNHDGIFLWAQLESGVLDILSLAEKLAEQNHSSADEMLPEVQEFLARLMNADIVEPC
ncbi:MAG: hypothetical protein AB7C89_01420 [Intestinibacillus sp.]